MPTLTHIFHLCAGRRYHRLFLLAGVLLTAWGVKSLAEAAMFVHEAERVSAEVVDVTQRPFLSPYRAFLGGDWKAEVAYYPHVNFQLPGKQQQLDYVLPDADANNHSYGERVDLLVLPKAPRARQDAPGTTAHLDAWKFIWGEATVHFFGGLLTVLLGRLLRGRRGNRRTVRRAEAPRQERREPTPAPTRTETPAPRRTAKKGQMELGLNVEDAPAKPKRKRRAPADSAPKSPRKRKKKEST